MMRFGAISTSTLLDSGVVETVEQRLHEAQTVKQATHFTEFVKVRSKERVLAEILKLVDMHYAGAAHDIAFATVTDGDNNIIRIEKSWTVYELR